MAEAGKPMPKINSDTWELYNNESGWQVAANKLTEAVTLIYKLIQEG